MVWFGLVLIGVVAGEEVRSAAAVQAVCEQVRGAGGFRDREREGGERQVGTPGNHQHGAIGDPRRQRAHPKHQDRRRGSPA